METILAALLFYAFRTTLFRMKLLGALAFDSRSQRSVAVVFQNKWTELGEGDKEDGI
jgi:hypothetical protein